MDTTEKGMSDTSNVMLACVAAFARSFRKDTIKEDGQQHMAALLSSIFIVAELFTIDIFDALWEKFPGVCTYCREKKCSCAFFKQKPDRDEAALAFFRAQEDCRPKTVQGWQELMRQIYGVANEQLSQIEVWMRVVEEAWEVEVELRVSNRAGIIDELADVFARTLGLCTKLGLDAEDFFEKDHQSTKNILP